MMRTVRPTVEQFRGPMTFACIAGYMFFGNLVCLAQKGPAGGVSMQEAWASVSTRAPLVTSSISRWTYVDQVAPRQFDEERLRAETKARAEVEHWTQSQIDARLAAVHMLGSHMHGETRQGEFTARFDGKNVAIDLTQKAIKDSGEQWVSNPIRHVDFSNGEFSSNFKVNDSSDKTDLGQLTSEWGALERTKEYRFDHTVGVRFAPLLFCGASPTLFFKAGNLKSAGGTNQTAVLERLRPPTDNVPVEEFERLTVSLADGRPIKIEIGSVYGGAKTQFLYTLEDYRPEGGVELSHRVVVQDFTPMGTLVEKRVYVLKQISINQPSLVGDIAMLGLRGNRIADARFPVKHSPIYTVGSQLLSDSEVKAMLGASGEHVPGEIAHPAPIPWIPLAGGTLIGCGIIVMLGRNFLRRR
ncbi:MAG TPA: hypothetical protein VHE55_07180 [Fimbriimonadaceae bacterium]|nr:hypothetical protein [Fimbriimonadaceae bacterium]